MPIYELNGSGIERLQKTTFADQGIRERQHIQRLLRDPIDIISEKTMLTVNGQEYPRLNKRNLMRQLVSIVIENDVKPDEFASLVSWRRGNLFISFDGELDEEQFAEWLMTLDTGGKLPKTKRYFCKRDELFVADGKTYAMTNQWGRRTIEAVDLISSNYPQLKISIEKQ